MLFNSYYHQKCKISKHLLYRVVPVVNYCCIVHFKILYEDRSRVVYCFAKMKMPKAQNRSNMVKPQYPIMTWPPAFLLYIVSIFWIIPWLKRAVVIQPQIFCSTIAKRKTTIRKPKCCSSDLNQSFDVAYFEVLQSVSAIF